MWCAIQVSGDGGKALWLSNPDLKGHRSVGPFENAAVFWRVKHAEAAIHLYMRQKNVGTSQIRIVDVGEKILSATATG